MRRRPGPANRRTLLLNQTDRRLEATRELLTSLGRARALGLPPDLKPVRKILASVWPDSELRQRAAAALADPYLAHTMLWRTFVLGWRGNPNHLRPLDQDGQRLSTDLLTFLGQHTRLRAGLTGLVDWPRRGLPAEVLLTDADWCDLCGECCCHCGTVPTPPLGVDYPAFFYHLAAGEGLTPQPYCPFLFQSLGRPLFFCGLHPIKPLACRAFDQRDCARGRPHRAYRQ